MISSCGLPAVPVGEHCGGVQLLIWDAHSAACPLIHHFNISFCQKNCCKKRSTLVMHVTCLVDHMGCVYPCQESGLLCQPFTVSLDLCFKNSAPIFKES
jgi:hypothetical protein